MARSITAPTCSCGNPGSPCRTAGTVRHVYFRPTHGAHVQKDTRGQENQASKERLRRLARHRRAQAARAAGGEAAGRLRAAGLALLRTLPGQVVAGYVPVKDEIDITPLLEALHAQGRTIVLPVVAAPGAPLLFRHWHPGQRLEKGRFGIPVPPAHAPALTPDILLVPLLAFDAMGHRLGYGGGYYDRTLAQLRQTGAPLAIGCAYAAQEMAAIPTLPHDVRLDWILTEQGARRPQPPREAP